MSSAKGKTVVVPAPIEGPESGTKPRTILVVEDEVLIRMMISEALRSRGFAVIEAATAEEGLIVLQSDTPVDLLLSDIRLPGALDGVALATWVRANKPELKIVIAASHLGLTPAGAVDAVFDKPYDLDEVGDCIANLLAGRHGD
jgi:CheY-like chemotaxis protein